MATLLEIDALDSDVDSEEEQVRAILGRIDEDYESCAPSQSDNLNPPDLAEKSASQLDNLNPLNPPDLAENYNQVKVVLYNPVARERVYVKNCALEGNVFYFARDPQLTQLTNIAITVLMVYRARNVPHWTPAELYGGEVVGPGEFLIFKSSSWMDFECKEVSAYIRELHSAMDAASPRHPVLPVPYRHRNPNWEEEYSADSTDSDTSEESYIGMEVSASIWRSRQAILWGAQPHDL